MPDPSALHSVAGQVPPTGTVTFLFTDIEGSTQLLQRLCDAYVAVLADHHAILRAAFGKFGGREIDTQGDAFFVVFPRASDALGAVADAQRALAAHAWPDSATVRVRMGLHTGEATLTEIGYVGLEVHRAARICSAGHGGQVLLSQTTRDLVESELPDGVSLRDLGEHQFKDLRRPQRIFQLVIRDLSSDFPPLKTLDVRPNNLPVQLTGFVGREKEIAEVKQLITTHRLLTLTGSGGAGKTRLSLQAAAELIDSFEHGVWFVELAPLADPGLAPQNVATVLGVREQAGQRLQDTLIDYLRNKELLLVLDNCEHLIEACAQLADALLHACLKLKILASSREALGIAGETPFRVPSLATPDARQATSIDTVAQCESVRLFIERAATALPGFMLTPDNASAITQVCQRLDGIPLAIELAAARVKVLRVEQIAVRLDDRFRLLTGGSRTAVPRHQTLRALIDWSYSLLSETERTLFRRLAVFAGGWTLEAAEVVCAGDGVEPDEILDLLTHLVDKSLVIAEREQGQETRYRTLETIRQYARDRLLEAGEAEPVRARHVDFFLAFAVAAEPKLHSPGQVTWLKRLDAEYDNLRAALDWAVESGRAQLGLRLDGALHLYCWARGYWSEGRERLERLLARPEAAERTSARAAAFNVAGSFAFFLGDPEASQALVEEGKAISLELGAEGKPYLAESLMFLGAGMINRDKAVAQRAFDECLVLLRETGEPWRLALGLQFRGDLASDQGDYALARALYSESLALRRKMGDTWGIGISIGHLGTVLYLLGDYSAASSHYQEALAIYRAVGDKSHTASILDNLGSIAVLQGDYQQAAVFFDESLAICRELGSKKRIAWALGDLGIAAGYLGDHARAAALLSEALPLSQEVGRAYIIALCLLGLAGIQRQPLRAAQMLAAAQTAFEASDEIVEPLYRIEHERSVNATRVALGDEAFATAWAEGRAMTLEQAIAYALETKDD